MFRNKVLVRAAPSAPPPPFLLRQVSLPAAVPPLDVDLLCSRLSRRHRLACLPQPPADALLLYQRCQSRAAAEAVREILAASPGASVAEEEEEVVCSGSFDAKAVECGLRCLMLEHGWSCVGESVYVHSKFAADEERTDLCAVNVDVKLGRNGDLEFVVSPDALQFTAHKFFDFASSDMMETFKDGKEVILDYCNFQTACTTLPMLQEGHVIGFTKVLPSGQCLDKFIELCSLKHGLETNDSYHVAVRLAYGYGSSLEWLPCSLVLQGSGLQPAIKSSRESKAMSALRSFMELLKAWDFFGQNQLVIKEHLLINCVATLPTWEKALTSHTTKTDNSEDLHFARTNFVSKDQSLNLDFRTPKPAVLSSSSAKLWNTKAREITLSLDIDDTGKETNSVNLGCQSQPIALTSSYKSQVTLLKPSFSRGKSEQKNKRKHSSDHSDADCSNKSSLPSLTSSAQESFPKSSDTNYVVSSSASILKPVMQVSRNQKRNHAESLDRSCQRATSNVQLQEKENLDSRRKSKDYITGVPAERKAIPSIQKDAVSTKVIKIKSSSMVCNNEITATAKIKAKQKVDKDELTAVTKPATLTKDVKDEFTKKEVDHQNDGAATKVKKAKARPVVDNVGLTSTNTKTKPDVVSDEMITAKVTDHHNRGELRLLTVADLKCFLGAKKAKVGGTKEVLIKRAAELLA